MAKISVSIDDELLARVREQSGGNVSAWLAAAAERRLRSEARSEFVAAVEAESGPLTEAELARADAWLSSSATPVS